MWRADGGGGDGSGSFDGALSQVINGARKSPSSLDEQFERLILKGISMDADSSQPCTDIVARLGGAQADQGPKQSRAVRPRGD